MSVNLSDNSDFSKEAFEYCNNVSWNEEKMQEFAALNNTVYDVVKNSALDYAKNNKKEDEYLKAVMLIKKNRKKKDIYSLDIPNPILLKYKGIKVYTLWRNYEESQFVLKHIFDIWKNDNYDCSSIVKEFGITRKFADSLIDDYIRYCLRRDPVSFRNKLIKPLENKYAKVFEKLLLINDIEEMKFVIKNSNFNPSNLRYYIHDFLIVHHNDKYNEYYNHLDDLFNKYFSHNSELRVEKRKDELESYFNNVLPSARRMIELYIESDCDSIAAFIAKYNIEDSQKITATQLFKECVNIVKEKDPELYMKYEKKIQTIRGKNYAALMSVVQNVVNLLVNGIDDGNTKRKFDLIDYFCNCKLSFDTAFKVSREMFDKKMISNGAYKAFSTFVNVNSNGDKTVYSDIDVLMSEKREVKCRKDKDGFPIANTGEIVTDELKIKIVDYLKDNNIPVNYKTYRALLNRYNMDLISFNEDKRNVNK